jgi:hypothetical protein
MLATLALIAVLSAEPQTVPDCCVRRVYSYTADGAQSYTDLPDGCQWCRWKLPVIDEDRPIAPCRADGGVQGWLCDAPAESTDQYAWCECTAWRLDSCSLVCEGWWTRRHCVKWMARLEGAR